MHDRILQVFDRAGLHLVRQLITKFCHDWENLASFINTIFFYAKANFTLAKLRRMRQYPWEDLDVYVKRFHKMALHCCDSMVEEVLIDVCLHGMME